MYIKSIQLDGYRNYKNATVYFDKGTNILYGDNAQGKTNVLESIFMCATTKSHKGSKDKEVIGFDEKEAHITLYLEKNYDEYKIDIKEIRQNEGLGQYALDQPYPSIDELFASYDGDYEVAEMSSGDMVGKELL